MNKHNNQESEKRAITLLLTEQVNLEIHKKQNFVKELREVANGKELVLLLPR